jgi:hypothetical protein
MLVFALFTHLLVARVAVKFTVSLTIFIIALQKVEEAI